MVRFLFNSERVHRFSDFAQVKGLLNVYLVDLFSKIMFKYFAVLGDLGESSDTLREEQSELNQKVINR